MRRRASTLEPRPPADREQPDAAAQDAYWATPPEELLHALVATPAGLGQADATERLARYGVNAIRAHEQATAPGILLKQFKSPLVLILIFAAVLSITLGEWTDAAIILAVVLGSAVLGFVQEFRASKAIESLRHQVTQRSEVLRDGQAQRLPSDQVVPGDVVLLSAGRLIPADGIALEVDDLFVNQAVLTGETFPVEKRPGAVAAKAALAERTNCLLMGTSVTSGTGHMLVIRTGKGTVFGQVAERLSLRPPENEFERGVHRFGDLLTRVMVVMVLAVLSANLLLSKPPVDSLLFALALAVGLTPELLPAIITITLSHGAQQLVHRGVIVRRLNAIESLGSMDVLCTDKTGTLTEGVVRLDGAFDAAGLPSEAVMRAAYLNAHYQVGLENAMDAAIVASAERDGLDVRADHKVGEIPYDFVRKRLTVVVAGDRGGPVLVTKGALDNVLSVCDTMLMDGQTVPLDGARRPAIDAQFTAWSEQGYRVLGVATRTMPAAQDTYTRADERALTFAGFLLFFDPPKADAGQAVADLAARGVAIKVITGDNHQVARHIADAVHLPVTGVLTGAQVDDLRDEALWHLAERTTLFAEVDPNQKERIILALRKTGHVVGYMGDGINDAPALHSADVSISVDSAVDVAKDAADLVLMKKDLSVLAQGIDEGRRTFANTLKYVLTTISANFGNMLSMAAASVLLPFLPLLAPQILLNNFLSDIPATAIASDNVDRNWLDSPHRWNTRFIRNYMIVFGVVSSVFDLLTFGVLLLIFRSSPEQFRTGWFVESLLSELVIALVVRTRYLFFRSRPGRLLLMTTGMVVVIALALPYLPFSTLLDFVPLPAPLLLAVIGLTLLYVLATEVAKRAFYARVDDTGIPSGALAEATSAVPGTGTGGLAAG